MVKSYWVEVFPDGAEGAVASPKHVNGGVEIKIFMRQDGELVLATEIQGRVYPGYLELDIMPNGTLQIENHGGTVKVRIPK